MQSTGRATEASQFSPAPVQLTGSVYVVNVRDEADLDV